MDELRLLLSATGLGDRAEQLKQDIIWAVAWGLAASIAAAATVGLLALALYSTLLVQHGAVNAALLSAAIFAGVTVVCGIVAWHCHRRSPARAPLPRDPDPMDVLAKLGGRETPFKAETFWDIATLVAVGVIAGNSKRHSSQ